MPSGETSDMSQTTARSSGRTAAWLGLLPLLLLAAALLVRAESLQESILRNVTNVPILKHVMDAVAGEPAPLPSSLPRLSLPAGLNGTQARALGRMAAEQGRPEEAERWLVAGLTDESTAGLTRFALCRLYLSEGKLDEAKATCANTVVSAPFWIGRGIEASDAGKTEEAIVYFDMARTTDPNQLEAWQRLGQALYQQRRLAEAVPVLEHLMAVQATSSPDLYHQLAEAYLATGRTVDAIGLLEHGLRQYPAERALYLAMAEAQSEAGDLVAADAWYARMLERWPQDAFAWAARGEVAVRRDDMEDAVAYFEQATKHNPEAVGYWTGLAGAAEATGRYKRAAEAYARALALEPNDAVVWMQAGRVLMATDRIDEARAAFRQALALQPENQEAQQLLAALDAPATTSP
jgi:tetratricopeptide (TPR) repeat protein